MSGDGNQVPLAPNQRGPGPYPTATTPHRDCYHQGAGAAYLAGNPGVAQAAQQSMRVPAGQQPPQSQDLPKNVMHNFVGQPGQGPQPRQQFANFPYRPAQHGPRPTGHPRQFLSGAATGTPSMMYHHPQSLMYPPHMAIPQSYQQRSPQYYPSLPQFINYSNAASHAPYYYAPSTQQLPAATLTQNAPGDRATAATLMPQGAPANPTAPAAPMSHMQQGQPHMNQNVRPTKRVSHRVPIIDPVTQQDILYDIYSNENQNASADSSERQTPQPDNSIVEEFARRVSEVASQPSASEMDIKMVPLTKNVEIPVPISSPISSLQPIAVNTINNSKSQKGLGMDIAAEYTETPIVSAISDSPAVVPKMSSTNKKHMRNDPPLVVDKNTAVNKSLKQNKSKSVSPSTVDEKIVEEPTPVVAELPVHEPELNQPQKNVEDKISHVNDDVIEVEPSQLQEQFVGPNGGTTDFASVQDDIDQVNPNILTSEPVVEEVIQQLSSETILPVSTSEITEAVLPDNDATKDTVLLTEPPLQEIVAHSAELIESNETHDILNQSLTTDDASNQIETNIKDINLNNEQGDPDTANGNTLQIPDNETDQSMEDINKNGDSLNKSEDLEATVAAPSKSTAPKDHDSCEETNEEKENVLENESPNSLPSPEAPAPPPVFVPKYNYGDDQWSPLNKSGKKCYDLSLLKQIKEHPLSKKKPEAPKLEQCNVMRAVPMMEPLSFTHLANIRPTSDALFPNFLKSPAGISKNILRDAKKDNRNVNLGKGSMKLNSSPSGSSPLKHNVIHVSLSLREDIKLNETENAWKPSRFKQDNVVHDEAKTQELYKKFRGILNKLTPEKFDKLLDRVKNLEIDTQERLEGVIDLVFEKAIEEPNFSEAYANMCNKLSKLKVPAQNASSPDQCVNFRALIISKCQAQFVTNKVDEQVEKLEKEFAECTDPVKKKELQLMLEEENRRARKRSVGNVRFIGELYKLKMLTSKIMVYCMNYLIDKLEEEKLECLCKLLTTIGQQVESEVKDKLNAIFAKMQDIVDRKSNKISNRVRFMIQDVIELRKRCWVAKSIVDLQPKMMDQIQKEAEQQQRQTELLNSSMGGYRRDEGGRGKRGDSRRQNQNAFIDNSNNWKTTRNNYSVDTSKLKVATNKNLDNIKLAPQKSQWGHGSGTKSSSTTSPLISLPTSTTNKYSVLENAQTDPTVLRGNKDIFAVYQPKGASIERSTFNSRGDFSSSGNGSKSGSMGVPRQTSSRSATPPATTETTSSEPALQNEVTVPQEPLSDPQKALVKSIIEQCLIVPDDNELVEEFKQRFKPEYHSAIITEILNIALEKPAKDIAVIAKSVLYLVSTNTISPNNFETGLIEIFEIAPDLYIDIPMLYNYLSMFVAPQIEKKYFSISQLLRLSKNIIVENQGHLVLKSIITDLNTSMGPTFVKSKWQEAECQLNQWMNNDQVKKFIEDNKFEFLEGGDSIEVKKVITPSEAQSKLLQLMNADENCECIRGWIHDNLSKVSNEDWFMRSLIQAICEHALFGAEKRGVPHFNQDRMNKYSELINEFVGSKKTREAICLFGIQQLIHRLEHPQGLTLEIFQYLHEQYIISVEGFIAWEESEKEPEGKGVMMKALTSFFTNIKEADNEDSFSD